MTTYEYYINNKDYFRIKNHNWRSANPVEYMLIQAKKRAKRYNREFSITLSDIKTCPLYCELTKVKLLYGNKGKKNPCSASLDRIDNAKGYIPGNIQIISDKANSLKDLYKYDKSLTQIERDRISRLKWYYKNKSANTHNLLQPGN